MFEELKKQYQAKVDTLDQQKQEFSVMIEFVNQLESMMKTNKESNSQLELIGKLVDRVDHLSKEVSDLRSQAMMNTQPVILEPDKQVSTLDSHANALVAIMAEKPGRYTTSELVDMLGMNKTSVINIMKRAVSIDPKHVTISKGKRRKLFLTYTPNKKDYAPSKPMSKYGGVDEAKIELMAMT